MPPEDPPDPVRTPRPPNRIRSQQPPSDVVLALVAELRAAGTTWPAVAARLGRGESTVRRWPRRYPDRWLAAILVAERRQVLDSGAESVLALRQLLRSDDPKHRRDAAKVLLALRVDLGKLDVKAKFAPQPPALTPEDADVLTFIHRHPHEDLAGLARDFPAALPPGPGPAEPAADRGPG